MTITRNFKLYLNAGTASAPYINVNQYDEGEEWVFTLYNEDGSTYTPSTGAIIGIKSDGNAIMNSGSVVGGKVVITETEQMTAASGRAIYELLIDNATHGTANFIVNVERRPSDDAEFSDSDLSMLQEAIDAAEVINKILDEGGDPSEIIAENVNAWLDNHPEATTTVLDGAITAPKINNSLWDKLLVNEEASGNPASFDDGADDVPVSSLKVALELIQLGSGDPSPSNVRPIIASNGKNLFQIASGTKTQNGVTWVVDGNGTITSSGISTATSFSSDTESVSLPSGTYTASVIGQNANIAMTLTKDGSWFRSINAGGTYTFTLNAPATITGYCQIATGLDASGTTYIMLEEGSSASPYQPYQGIMVERTGKNRLTSSDGYTNRGVTKSVNSDGSVTLTGTATQLVDMSLVSSPVLETGVTYRMVIDKATGWNGTGNVLYAIISNGSTTRYVGCGSSSSTLQTTFTLASDEYVGNCFLRVANGVDTGGQTVKVMIIKDGESTSYEPYTSTSYPYTLGQSVYGGTVDLATGVLTVTHKMVELNGNSSITYNSNRFYANGFNDFARKMEYTRNEIISDKLPTVSNYGAVTNNGLGIAGYASATSYPNQNWIYFGTGDPNITTLVQMKEWLAENPITVCYELKTPQTIQLTPTEVKTLLGYNNISSTGTVEVIYHADTKLYVDKKIGELS